MLDQVPIAVEMGVQVYPLQYADAESVGKLLEDMFKQGKDLPKPSPGSESTEAVPESAVGQAMVYNVGLVADVRTNTLIASGRPAQLALIHTVINQLDQPGAATKFPLRLIEIGHSDATQIGKVLEDLFEKRVESLEEAKGRRVGHRAGEGVPDGRHPQQLAHRLRVRRELRRDHHHRGEARRTVEAAFRGDSSHQL